MIPMRKEAEAEAVAFGELDPESSAQVRVRASSVTNTARLPSLPRVVTTESDARARSQAASDTITAAMSALSSGALVTAHPSSLADARERVHKAAGHYEGLLWRGARLTWGYGWLCLKAALNLLEWLAESPARFITAVVLIALAVLFL